MRKNMTKLFSFLLILSLPIFLVLTSLDIATYDLNFYTSKYTEYNISQSTGISNENLMQITEELLKYFKGKRNNILIYTEINEIRNQVFKERELLHLKDIQDLFKLSYKVKLVTLIFSLISIGYLFFTDKKKLAKSMITAALIPIGLMIILAIIVSVNFYNFFTYFHEVLFTNDLWQLDPEKEILIQMYPLEFFQSIAFKIIKLFVIQLAILITLGIAVLSLSKKKKRSL